MEEIQIEYLGNLNGWSTSYFGATYDPQGLSPTIADCRGGSRIQLIVEIKEIKNERTKNPVIG